MLLGQRALLMAGIHKAQRTLSHGAELFRQVLSFDPSPTYSFEANELEGYEANLSEGDSEFDSDIDSHDEML